MKFENLVFQKKAGGGARTYSYSYPNVTIRRGNSGGKRTKTVCTFRACDSLYESNTHCVYAIAGNRLYFMFCGDSKSAYKLFKPTNSKTYQMHVQYNKEISKFIRDKEYTPKLDNECGLWYIEY